MIYGLGDRNEQKELKARYDAMVHTFACILNCGLADIQELFDSRNNIEVGEIIKDWVSEMGELPNWNRVYREAMLDFASEHGLKVGKDIDIYTNYCLDTNIYAREGLDPEIIEELEDLFNMNCNVLK